MKQKGLTPIVIVVLIAALIGGYLLYQNQTKPTPPPQQTTQPSPTPATTSVPNGPAETVYTEASRSANWKIFSLQSSFEIKYPQTWDFYELEKNDIAFGPEELVKINRERLENPNIAALIGGKAWPAEIKPLKANLYFYGPNEVSFVSDEYRRVSSKEVIIDGLSAVRHIIMFNIDAPYINKGDIIEVVLVKKGNSTYSITLSDQKYKGIFDQILSTFKFLP